MQLSNFCVSMTEKPFSTLHDVFACFDTTSVTFLPMETEVCKAVTYGHAACFAESFCCKQCKPVLGSGSIPDTLVRGTDPRMRIRIRIRTDPQHRCKHLWYKLWDPGWKKIGSGMEKIRIRYELPDHISESKNNCRIFFDADADPGSFRPWEVTNGMKHRW
jgi:hypothetical protein